MLVRVKNVEKINPGWQLVEKVSRWAWCWFWNFLFFGGGGFLSEQCTHSQILQNCLKALH